MSVYEINTNFLYGVNSGVGGRYVDDGFVHGAVNLAFRTGTATTRPSFKLVVDKFFDNVGLFQGCSFYKYKDNRFIVFAYDGVLYAYDLRSGALQNFMRKIPRMSSRVHRFRFKQVFDTMIVMDGVNQGVVIEGATARVLQSSKVSPYTGLPGELRVGYHLAFTYGQMAYQLPNTPLFFVGDPHIPNSGSTNYLFDSLNQYASSGAGSLSAQDTITAMHELSLLDTPDGVGPLLVFSENRVESFDLRIARSNWGLQAISQTMLNRGTLSPDSIVGFNNDIIFRSLEGQYSLRGAKAESQSRVFLSYSKGNSKYLTDDTRDSLPYVSSALFDNRVLLTVSPRFVDVGNGLRDCYWKGFAVTDHDLDKASREQAFEISEGVWTGLDILSVVTGNGQCFVFSRNDNGTLSLSELTTDTTGSDYGNVPIEYSLETRTVTSSPSVKISIESIGLNSLFSQHGQGACVVLDDARMIPVQFSSEGSPYRSVNEKLLGMVKPNLLASSTHLLSTRVDTKSAKCRSFHARIYGKGYCAISEIYAKMKSDPETGVNTHQPGAVEYVIPREHNPYTYKAR